MADTNVKLSAQELGLVTNRDWLLMKRDILEKAASLLASVQDRMDAHTRLQTALRSYALPATMPKISKGENYRGFPYLVLDHPRVLAVRMFFPFAACSGGVITL
jgi:hypothetical protein